MNLEKTLASLQANSPHLLIAEHFDGTVALHGASDRADAVAWLLRLSTHLQLTRLHARVAAGAIAIARQLAARLERRTVRITVDRTEVIFRLADFEHVIAILGDYDLESGKRQRAGVLELDAAVYVPEHGEGRITGFSMCGRVIVKLSRPDPRLCVVAVLAPRTLVQVRRPAGAPQ